MRNGIFVFCFLVVACGHENVVFYLLPSHDEAVIFSALGFAIPDGSSKLALAHAADKLTFIGDISADGREIGGGVSAALSGERASFLLSR